MIFFRKLHKWLGLIIGVQMLVWLITGMLISVVDQRTVSGGSTRLPAGERPPLAQFQPLYPARQLPISTDALQQIKLTSVLAYPVYRVVYQGKPSLFDARTGDEFIIDQALAEQIARNSYRGEGELTGSERLDQGSEDMRGVSGAMWQVNFDDPLATRAYISAVDGRLLAHRNNRWALVDFLLMLHFMDYMRNDSFNTPQAIVFGFGALWLAISGLLLVFSSYSRADFRWLPGALMQGAEVNVVARSDARRGEEVALDSALTVYAGLSLRGIKLPSNCDGSGSCGLCKVSYGQAAPEATAVDREWIGAARLENGERLACQHKPRSGDDIVVPDIAWQTALQQGEITATRWLTPLLKEICLKPDTPLQYKPGEYMQFLVPPYRMSRDQLDVPEQFLHDWAAITLADEWQCTQDLFRAYSLATAPNQGDSLAFTVRFSPPPTAAAPLPEAQLPPGIGSAYMCRLRPGDRVEFRGPAGDFQLADSDCEKILIGGGAGMAPLKSMVLYLLKSQSWQGKLRFWYGARNQQEILYRHTFESLAEAFPNFEWGVALSDADDDETWLGERGFIHQVVLDNVLRDHDSLRECEFYLCGPPLMLEATRHMLGELGVAEASIRFDDFGN
jgi:Na(+)-translocating NADH:ubiquinone oxidoreductase F subunit